MNVFNKKNNRFQLNIAIMSLNIWFERLMEVWGWGKNATEIHTTVHTHGSCNFTP